MLGKNDPSLDKKRVKKDCLVNCVVGGNGGCFLFICAKTICCDICSCVGMPIALIMVEIVFDFF